MVTWVGLADQFDDNGNVLWDAGIAYNAAFTGGRLVIATAPHYPTIWALPHIDLTGQTVTVQLVSPPNSQSASNAYFQLGNWSDLAQYLGFMWTPGGVVAEHAQPSITNRGTVAYAAGMWFRIGESAGTVRWWTSTNGTAWTERGSMATAAVGFPITDLQFKLGSGNWQAQSNLGTAVWDNAEATGDYYPVADEPHGLAHGFFVPQDGSAESINDIQTMIGADVSHVLWFADVPNAVPTSALQSIVSAGRIPVVGLEPWDSTVGGPNQTAWKLSATIAGNHDAHYTRWANALKNLPGEVWMRFAHEMNGTWYPWAAGGVNGNTNAQYVAAWRHVRDLFDAAGATNVKWMWAPNTHFGGAPHYGEIYPGDAWVDLLGVDGYNWVEGTDPDRWRETPAALYSESLARLRAVSPGKKIWIAECSTAERAAQSGTYKAAWIGQFFTYLASQPDVDGYLWFHINKERDWRINSTPQASAAFTAAVAALPSEGGAAVPVAGTVAAVSGVSGAVTARPGLSGVVSAVSGAAGQVDGRRPVAGAAAAVSETVGGFGVRRLLAGTVAAVSGVSGALAGTSTMAGVAAGLSEASGRVILRGTAAGTAGVVSGATGALQGTATTTTTTTTVLPGTTTTTTTVLPPPVVEVWRPHAVAARHEGRGWTAQLMMTMTGQVMPPLTLLGGSWTDGPLNDATSGSIKVAVAELKRYHAAWWSKWSGSVLVCFNGWPVVAGPITADPSGFQTTDLKFGGFFSILEYRYATAADFFPGSEGALAASILSYSGMNAGGIAADLVRRGMNRPNGRLPFAVASPTEEGTADRIRNYLGHNISNNSVAKLVKEITAVINGPDVAYRPEWAPGQRGEAVRWVQYHGTEGMPQIAQGHTFSIDLTAPQAQLMEPAVTKDSGTLLGRVYMTGQGEGETTEMVIVERPTGMPAYMPMLETVVSDTQASNANGLLARRGEALVTPAETVQLSVNLSATNAIMPLNTWFTGDEFLVRTPELLHVKRGTHRMRVVSRSGSFDSNIVKLELQPEEVYQR